MRLYKKFLLPVMLCLFTQPVFANVEDINVTQTLATQGDDISQNKLGVMYYDGQGVTQNYEKAFEWFSKAAAQGNADAQYSLGVMYYYSQGMTQNYKKAFEWLSKAAVQGGEMPKIA